MTLCQLLGAMMLLADGGKREKGQLVPVAVLMSGRWRCGGEVPSRHGTVD